MAPQRSKRNVLCGGRHVSAAPHAHAAPRAVHAREASCSAAAAAAGDGTRCDAPCAWLRPHLLRCSCRRARGQRAASSATPWAQRRRVARPRLAARRVLCWPSAGRGQRRCCARRCVSARCTRSCALRGSGRRAAARLLRRAGHGRCMRLPCCALGSTAKRATCPAKCASTATAPSTGAHPPAHACCCALLLLRAGWEAFVEAHVVLCRRKKWEACWDEVKFCSAACRASAKKGERKPQDEAGEAPV